MSRATTWPSGGGRGEGAPLDPQPLLDGSPGQRQGRFVGIVRVRTLKTYTGCTEPPTLTERVFLEWAGNLLPVASLTGLGPEERKRLMEQPGALKSEWAHLRLWTPADLDAQGIAPGTKVAVTGVLGPLYASGTEAMMFYPGFALERIERAGTGEPLAPSPPVAPNALPPARPPPGWVPAPDDPTEDPKDRSASFDALYQEIHDRYRQLGLGETETTALVAKLRGVWDRVPEERRREIVVQMVRALRRAAARAATARTPQSR